MLIIDFKQISVGINIFFLYFWIKITIQTPNRIT
jgi:hypothetical protein